jgi:hypothetical protein
LKGAVNYLEKPRYYNFIIISFFPLHFMTQKEGTKNKKLSQSFLLEEGQDGERKEGRERGTGVLRATVVPIEVSLSFSISFFPHFSFPSAKRPLLEFQRGVYVSWETFFSFLL